MANKIVSLLLQVKDMMTPSVKKAAAAVAELDAEVSKLGSEFEFFSRAQEAAQNLDKVREASEEAGKEFVRTRDELAKLQQKYKEDPSDELALSIDKARIAQRAAQSEWRSSLKTIEEYEELVVRAGGSLDDLGAAETKFASKAKDAEQGLEKKKSALDKAREKLRELRGETDKSSATMSTFGKTVAGVFAGLSGYVILNKLKDGFASLTKSIFTTGDEFERLGKRLTESELDYVAEFARNTPLELNAVAEAFARLRTFGLDPTNGSLQALVDMNAKMGGGQQELEGIILAVGQAWSKQKLQQEEALQLIERGVPVWELLAKATGKTVPELQKLATAGKLGRDEISLLLTEIGRSAEGEAAKAMDSLSGIVSNLKDDVTSFYREIADKGALETLKDAFKGLRGEISALADSGQLEQIAQWLSDFLSSVVRNSGKAVEAIGSNFGVLVGSARMITNTVAGVFNAFRVGVLGTVRWTAEAVAGLADLAGFDGFAEKAQFAADAFRDATNDAINDVSKNVDNFVDGALQLPKTFQEIAAETLVLKKAQQEVGNEAEATAAKTEESAVKMTDAIKEFGEEVEGTPEKVEKITAAVEEVEEETETVARNAQELAKALSGFFLATRNELAGLSEEAAAAFDAAFNVGDAKAGMDELTRAIVEAREEMGKIAIDNLQVFDASGANRFKNEVLAAKDAIIIAYSEQKQRFEQYMAALESGTGVTQSMINQAQTATQFMGLLGEQDLAQLRGALDDARQKLESISDAASNTLDQLQTELDRLQGNQDAINQRDYENKRQELQNAIEEAKRYGNQEAVRQYTEALKVLEEVRRERQKQATEQRQQQAQQRNTSASQSGSNSSTPANRGTTINLQSPSGNKSVQLNGDAKAVEQLLAVLEDAGLRSSSGY